MTKTMMVLCGATMLATGPALAACVVDAPLDTPNQPSPQVVVTGDDVVIIAAVTLQDLEVLELGDLGLTLTAGLHNSDTGAVRSHTNECVFEDEMLKCDELGWAVVTPLSTGQPGVEAYEIVLDDLSPPSGSVVGDVNVALSQSNGWQGYACSDAEDGNQALVCACEDEATDDLYSDLWISDFDAFNPSGSLGTVIIVLEELI